MAEASLVSKEDLYNENVVLELSQRGDEIPEMYIQKDSISEAIDVPAELWNDTLLIDSSLLSSSDDNELAKLKSALSNWGFFALKNHGMKRTFLEEFMEVSKEFFGLPLEEKLKSSYDSDTLHGYRTDARSLFNDNSWNDRLFLNLYPEEERCLHLWPQNPPKFRKNLDEFMRKLQSVLEGVYMAMSRSLELEDEIFLNLMKEGSVIGKLNIYPRCSCPERVMGLRQHTDGSFITVLLVEPGVEGLQIQKDGEWFKVPTIPGSIFIILGDVGQVMTNGIFKSVVHRVVTNSTKDRISWGAFCFPECNTEIGPVSKLISDDHPLLYKKIKMVDYKQTYIQNFVAGCPFDAFKL